MNAQQQKVKLGHNPNSVPFFKCSILIISLPETFLCFVTLTGPVSPQSVTVDSLDDDHVNISWPVSSFMLMTPHSYNVTMCAQKCKTFFYSHANGSSAMNISISNLTSVTQYLVEISAFVVRPNSLTGRNAILQNDPATLQITTGRMATTVFQLI